MRLDRLITLSIVHPLQRFRHRLQRLRDGRGWRFAPGEGVPPSDSGFSHFALRTSHLSRSLPILMYHSISNDSEPGVSPYYRVTTSPARFADQMRWLSELGYRGVTLTEGLAWLKASQVSGQSSAVSCQAPGPAALHPPPSASLACCGGEGRGEGAASGEIGNRQSRIVNSKLVVLTFDDGFRDFHTSAWPVLRQHGFTATMFLPTAFINDSEPVQSSAFDVRCSMLDVSSQARHGIQPRRPFAGKQFLTWNEVRELHESGIEFGSHTVNHPELIHLPWSQIDFELRTSKLELEARLGCAVSTFAYPYAYPEADAAFTGRFESLLRAAGYACSVTTRIGRVSADDKPYALRRLPVNEADDLALLQAKLEGAYDWLFLPQSLAKLRKTGRRPADRAFPPAPPQPVVPPSGNCLTSVLRPGLTSLAREREVDELPR